MFRVRDHEERTFLQYWHVKDHRMKKKQAYHKDLIYGEVSRIHKKVLAMCHDQGDM